MSTNLIITLLCTAISALATAVVKLYLEGRKKDQLNIELARNRLSMKTIKEIFTLLLAVPQAGKRKSKKELLTQVLEMIDADRENTKES